ncbi:putative serine/threonine-protein kinase STE20-like [Drosophila serrata]|uniref:putative serine/threonine-protein kinase STE20-like n=1 Tax=Drosophila serrata TaxID=7274 RepID=UPI000A1CF404|nr:putative serine/threonine-protein kinase STE20-like [Drosophila serrata]
MFSDDFYQFVELCLTKSPISRWSASKLVTHSFLKQCRNTSISENLKDISFDLDTSKIKEDKSVLKIGVTTKRNCDDIIWSF